MKFHLKNLFSTFILKVATINTLTIANQGIMKGIKGWILLLSRSATCFTNTLTNIYTQFGQSYPLPEQYKMA